MAANARSATTRRRRDTGRTEGNQDLRDDAITSSAMAVDLLGDRPGH